MKKITQLEIYIDAIQEHEPFVQLEIRSVKIVHEGYEYVNDGGEPHQREVTSIEGCDESERDFYGLYAQSADKDDVIGDEYNGLWWSIADSPSKVELFELATAFNVFSKYTLPIITKFEF